jgi:hypothetical protein
MKRLSDLIIKYKDYNDETSKRFRFFRREGGEPRLKILPTFITLNYVDQHRICYQWTDYKNPQKFSQHKNNLYDHYIFYKKSEKIKYKYKGIEGLTVRKGPLTSNLSDLDNLIVQFETENDDLMRIKDRMAWDQRFAYSNYYDSFDFMSGTDFINVSSWYDNTSIEKRRLFFYETEFS